MARNRIGNFLLTGLVVIALMGFGLWMWVADDLHAVERGIAAAQQDAVPPRVVRAFVAEAGPSSVAHEVVRWYVHGDGLPQQARVLIVSRAIEFHLPRPQIERAYAASVNLGTDLHGPEAAARAYFHRGAGDLSVPQLAALAAATRSPELYSPRATSEAAVGERVKALSAMVNAGVISTSEFHQAKRDRLFRSE